MNHFKILKEFQGCLSIQLSKICIAQTQYLSGVLSLICYRLPRRLVYNIIRCSHCQQLFSKNFKKVQFFQSLTFKRTDMPAKPLVYWLSAHLHCNQKAKTYYYILIFISIRAIFLSAKISYIEKPTQTSNTTYCVGQFQVMCCFII